MADAGLCSKSRLYFYIKLILLAKVHTKIAGTVRYSDTTKKQILIWRPIIHYAFYITRRYKE